MKSQMIMLKDLNCPNCATKLQRAAHELPGVSAASVSFATGALHVQYDPEVLSEAGILKLVRRFGVDVSAVLPGPSH